MSLFEFAPRGACRTASHLAVVRGLLPHDFTLACFRKRGSSAVCFLWRFPSSRLGSPLATSLSCGARTFLPRALPRAGDPLSISSRVKSTVDPQNAMSSACKFSGAARFVLRASVMHHAHRIRVGGPAFEFSLAFSTKLHLPVNDVCCAGSRASGDPVFLRTRNLIGNLPVLIRK